MGDTYQENSWAAYITYGDNKGVARSSMGNPYNRGEAIVRLSPESPFISWNGKTVDLGSRQVRLSINVVTTLGVTEATYRVVTTIATCISGFLGAGWLWQLISLRKSAAPLPSSNSNE